MSLFKQHNIYTLFLIATMLPGGLMPTGSFLAVGVYYITIFLGLYYLIRLLQEPIGSKFIKGYIVFFGIMLIYCVFRFFTPDIHYFNGNPLPPQAVLKDVCYNSLPLFAYFYFSKHGLITRRWLVVMTFIVLVLSIASYYSNYQRMLLNTLEVGRTEFTNNMGYEFVALIPFLVLFKKRPLIQSGIALVLVFFIISSMKRGAILFGVLGLGYFVITNFRKGKTWHKLVFVLITIAAVAVLINFIQNLLLESVYFNERLQQTQEGYTSGRDVLFLDMMNYLKNGANPLQWLFGSGLDATVAVAGNLAHNDWLELLVDCGLLGVIIYFRCWYGYWKDLKRMPKDDDYHLMMIFSGVFMFGKTFISMGFADVQFGSMIALGCSLGILASQRSTILKERKNGKAYIVA